VSAKIVCVGELFNFMFWRTLVISCDELSKSGANFQRQDEYRPLADLFDIVA